MAWSFTSVKCRKSSDSLKANFHRTFGRTNRLHCTIGAIEFFWYLRGLLWVMHVILTAINMRAWAIHKYPCMGIVLAPQEVQSVLLCLDQKPVNGFIHMNRREKYCERRCHTDREREASKMAFCVDHKCIFICFVNCRSLVRGETQTQPVELPVQSGQLLSLVPV